MACSAKGAASKPSVNGWRRPLAATACFALKYKLMYKCETYNFLYFKKRGGIHEIRGRIRRPRRPIRLTVKNAGWSD
jgi:hypothetical protein